MDARKGPYQVVVFEGDMISLDIPKGGVVLESGWGITPATYPGVSLFCKSLNKSVFMIVQIQGGF